MKVLVINAGSSSLKYQLIDMTDESVLAKGSCERIGIDGGVFKQKAAGKEEQHFRERLFIFFFVKNLLYLLSIFSMENILYLWGFLCIIGNT